MPGLLALVAMAGVVELDDLLNCGVDLFVHPVQADEFGAFAELAYPRAIHPFAELALVGREELLDSDLFLTLQ